MNKKLITLFLFYQLICLVTVPAIAQEKGGHAQTKAFEFLTNKGQLLRVDLLSDKANNPVQYVANIATEVCSDSLCRPINLMMYWDLLGHFKNYITPVNEPLTKFDHIEFTAADTKKLREILADDRSMLKDYEAEDMIDRSIKVYSNKVNAVTGASSKTFQDVIVPGALYTVHTLWHLVNGEAAVKILDHTKSILNDTMIKWMLRSGGVEYQHFILTELTEDKLRPFANDIIELVNSKDENIPHYAMEKIPATLWDDEETQRRLLSSFASLKLEVQNTLLEKLKDRKIYPPGLTFLVQDLDKLNNIQIDKVFKILANNSQLLDKALKNLVSALSTSPSTPIAHGAGELLKTIKNK